MTHNKLCKILSLICVIGSVILILSTITFAYTPNDQLNLSHIMYQSFVYGQYADGSNAFVSNVITDTSSTYSVYNFVGGDNPDIYGHEMSKTKSVLYLYIPIYSSQANAYNYQFYVGSTNSTISDQLTVTAVHTLKGGVLSDAGYAQQAANSYTTTLQKDGSSSQLRYYLRQLTITPYVANADIIRITLANNSTNGIMMFGLYNIDVTGGAAAADQLKTEINNISANIQSVITEIQQSGDTIVSAINDNTTSTANALSTLTETTIKYGDDANYYLDAITYSTDGQQLVVQSLQQHFSTALQAIQAQNDIIHNNVINNAPAEQQVNQVISKDQIAPDVDAAVIGAGTSDSGIGIIMSQTRVIAMMVCVMGIAILSYLLFGRKT